MKNLYVCVCVCAHAGVWALANPVIPCYDRYIFNNYETSAALKKTRLDMHFTDQLKKSHSCIKHQMHKLR